MTEEDLILKVFFTYAWKRKPKKCQCGCGNYLPSKINTSCMDHLLEKREYPELKFSLGNIGFFTTECHTRKTNGHPNFTQQMMIDKALENYDSLKKESSIFETKVKKKIYGESNKG